MGAVIAALLLAACHEMASAGWNKPGADAAATETVYRDCRAQTGTAVRTDVDIDQDISAARASDLQHSSIVRQQSQDLSDDNRDRDDAILASCMQAKGFTRAP